jgi:uncharacterized membrane protein YphA (DoxX/SURF4 family)
VTVNFEINLRSSLRWMLGLLFLWAALSKIANLQDFYSSLVAYQLPLPAVYLRLAATTLPWLEFFCGLMLLSGFWLQTATLWALVLCVVFAVATGQAWARSLPISCGCFNLDFLGAAGKSSMVALLESVGFAFVRSLLLVAACVYLLRDRSAEGRHQAATGLSSPDFA